MTSTTIARALSVLLALPLAGHAAIVQNGGFENPDNTWENTAANYMAVPNGSTAITGWTVANATTSGVAWAKAPTNDGFAPSEGSYFVDLSGFGTQAGPDAALDQTLQNLIAGETYQIALDVLGDPVQISVAGTVIATVGGSSGWARFTTSFQATAASAALSIARGGSSPIAFIDNLTVTGREAGGDDGVAVPAPGSLGLVAAALAALAGLRRPARRRTA